MGIWEFTSSHLCTALSSHLSPCWQEKLFFWGTSLLCLLSVCLPFVQQSHQVGPCWPWLTPLGHCRTCVNLWWICDKQSRQKHHELRLVCVWGVELSSEDLEQLCSFFLSFCCVLNYRCTGFKKPHMGSSSSSSWTKKGPKSPLRNKLSGENILRAEKQLLKHHFSMPINFQSVSVSGWGCLTWDCTIPRVIPRTNCTRAIERERVP